MNDPRVVSYLLNRSFADLLRDHAVKASIGTRPYKASLNYDQFAAVDDDALACECRGLVIATWDGAPLRTEGVVGPVRVLARPMDRFFNHQQGAAPRIDLANPGTRVFEKLDGTLCIVYFDPHARAWCVATRAVPDADKPIGGFEAHTFRSLFEAALREHAGQTFEGYTAGLSPDWTYCFELTTPFNQVVVRHAASRLHLLAMRRRDGLELCPTEAANQALPVAPSHRVDSLEALLAFVAARPALESEGVVVRMAPAADGAAFRRVKVKSAAYLAAAHLTESVGASPRALLGVILALQYDDVAPLLAPAIRAHGDRMQAALSVLCADYDAAYGRLATATAHDANPRKALALAVQREGLWIAPLLERFAGKCDSFAGFLATARRDGGWSDAFLDSVLGRLPSLDAARRAA